MTGAISLLSGLLRRREQAAFERPSVGDELDNAAHGPAGFEFADDVDQIVTCTEAEVSAGLDQAVASSEALGAVDGPGEEEVLSAEGRFSDQAFDAAVVDLELTVREAASEEGALLHRVPHRGAERRGRR